ncbi:Predicted small lipoprotein YifL [Dyella jiangningensis]|uniref:LPS translocon maturation chaperone LptM n=1 Tax=Dyella sp. AtDHG13 TaxID=1938897 RepID=UPI000883AD18|nr:lipoprotein [Dyella sp. AtDHG13]PXV56986.1 putative small lipoprotein YifL [Dyella sp. AtDHG13]SDK63029.1 Predicted small lipoprotein YifL [Dyella jiangningensis]
MRRSLLLLPLCSALALLAGCGNKGPLYMPKATPAATVHPVAPAAPVAKPAAPTAPAAAAPVPVHGFVTDMQAFDAFIDTHPTPEQFRAAYPDVLLVLPGTVATRELRSNNSRYFADVDANGRITGGKFM